MVVSATAGWTHQRLGLLICLHRLLPVLLLLHPCKGSRTALAVGTAGSITLQRDTALLQSHVTEKSPILLGLSNPGFVLLPFSITTTSFEAHHFAQTLCSAGVLLAAEDISLCMSWLTYPSVALNKKKKKQVC